MTENFGKSKKVDDEVETRGIIFSESKSSEFRGSSKGEMKFTDDFGDERRSSKK
jgi:hypothetical protein